MNDDLIYKQDAIDILEDERRIIESALNKENFDIMRKQLLLKMGQNAEDIILISCLPPVKPVKIGKWIPVDSFSAFGGDEATWEAHGNPIAFYYCSVCKEQSHVDEFGEFILSNYCPDCGAKMEV